MLSGKTSLISLILPHFMTHTLAKQALLTTDAFAAALGAVPEDWCRTWAAGWTIMLRRTSKRVKEVVDKMRLSAVVRLSKGEQRKYGGLIARPLKSYSLFSDDSLKLPRSCPEMKGHDAERLARVLAQCAALAHLDLSNNGRDRIGRDRESVQNQTLVVH
jgi:hypothetical protein